MEFMECFSINSEAIESVTLSYKRVVDRVATTDVEADWE